LTVTANARILLTVKTVASMLSIRKVKKLFKLHSNRLRRSLVLDLFEAVKLRRSTRAFTEEEVSDVEVEKLLEAARWAPSAGNIQPWDFVVVRESEIKRKLAEAALDQSFIEEASVVIVVCADENMSGRGYGSRGVNLYCIQDTAAATENILLAACALGLGTCWVGAFNEGEVKEALNVPNGVRPVAIIPVGRPAERPHPPYKRSLKEIVHHKTF
jgi:nitroreductase